MQQKKEDWTERRKIENEAWRCVHHSKPLPHWQRRVGGWLNLFHIEFLYNKCLQMDPRWRGLLIKALKTFEGTCILNLEQRLDRMFHTSSTPLINLCVHWNYKFTNILSRMCYKCLSWWGFFLMDSIQAYHHHLSKILSRVSFYFRTNPSSSSFLAAWKIVSLRK
jgi:hypothetical protein